jgi:hypothetical protein
MDSAIKKVIKNSLSGSSILTTSMGYIAIVEIIITQLISTNNFSVITNIS